MMLRYGLHLALLTVLTAAQVSCDSAEPDSDLESPGLRDSAGQPCSPSAPDSCDGNVLRLCIDGVIEEWDCGETAACGEQDGFLTCLPTVCGSVSEAGECAGNTLRACQYDFVSEAFELIEEDCGDDACVVTEGGDGIAVCQSSEDAEICADLGVEGECTSATSGRYCSGSVYTFDCAELGQVCGDDDGIYACVDP